MQRILTIALGALIIVVGFSVSLVLFAFLLLFGGIAFAYYWWKTRHIRRMMKEHIEERMRRQQGMDHADGVIIDGEWRSDQTNGTNVETMPATKSGPDALPSTPSATAPEEGSSPKP